eukprot:1127248-Rhodomonas_salina.1
MSRRLERRPKSLMIRKARMTLCTPRSECWLGGVGICEGERGCSAGSYSVGVSERGEIADGNKESQRDYLRTPNPGTLSRSRARSEQITTIRSNILNLSKKKLQVQYCMSVTDTGYRVCRMTPLDIVCARHDVDEDFYREEDCESLAAQSARSVADVAKRTRAGRYGR